MVGGLGVNVCLTCWRRPDKPFSSPIDGDFDSQDTSRPGALFWTAGLRMQPGRRFFVEGRYRTISKSTVHLNRACTEGKTHCAMASVGYWFTAPDGGR